MKATLIWFGLLGLTSQVTTAGTILNGDFESGDSLFTTQYGQYSGTGSLLYGQVAVSTDPHAVHVLLASFGDHTSGQGNMLVVNGGPDPEAAFWSAELDGALSVGSHYLFSFWAASAYWSANAAVFADSPARLLLTVDGLQQGSEMALSSIGGQWMQFTVPFYAHSANPTIRLLDSNTTFNGNDFAIDDISVSEAPEPATWMLLAGGLAVAVLRRRKA